MAPRPATAMRGSPSGGGEIRSLTGLRGVAACLVMVYHFCGKQIGAGHVKSFIDHGYLWVDLFFALSGFVMAMTYASAFANGFHRRDYVAFLARRLARIYPLFLVMTLLTAFLQVTGISHNGRLPHLGLTLAANLLLIHSWGVAPSIDSPAWSISTEWAAYLLFPALVGVALFRSWRLAVAGLVLSAVIMTLVALIPTAMIGEDPMDRIGQLNVFSYNTPLPLLRCLAGFFAGLTAYRGAALLHGVSNRAMGWLSLAAGAAVIGTMAVWNSDLLCVALFPVLILLLSRDAGPLARALSWRPVHLLGVWSYAIYLLHPRTVRFSAYVASLVTHDPADARIVAVVVGCIVSIPLGATAYALIEKPGRGLVRRLTGAQGGHSPKRLIKPETADAPGPLVQANHV